MGRRWRQGWRGLDRALDGHLSALDRRGRSCGGRSCSCLACFGDRELTLEGHLRGIATACLRTSCHRRGSNSVPARAFRGYRLGGSWRASPSTWREPPPSSAREQRCTLRAITTIHAALTCATNDLGEALINRRPISTSFPAEPSSWRPRSRQRVRRDTRESGRPCNGPRAGWLRRTRCSGEPGAVSDTWSDRSHRSELSGAVDRPERRRAGGAARRRRRGWAGPPAHRLRRWSRRHHQPRRPGRHESTRRATPDGGRRRACPW